MCGENAVTAAAAEVVAKGERNVPAAAAVAAAAAVEAEAEANVPDVDPCELLNCECNHPIREMQIEAEKQRILRSQSCRNLLFSDRTRAVEKDLKKKKKKTETKDGGM